MDDEEGAVAEVTEGFCKKAKVAVPKEPVRADGEVGVKSWSSSSPTENKRLILTPIILGRRECRTTQGLEWLIRMAVCMG